MSCHIRPTWRSFLLVAAFAGFAPRVNAQRLLVPHDRPSALVALVDVRAGALVDGAWLDVQATAVPTPGTNVLRVAERVQGEIWVGGALWIYRYDATTREFLCSFQLAAPVRSIESQSRRVVVTTSDYIETYDFDGTLCQRFNVFGAGDTLELRDSMLVAIQDESRIDRYAFDGTWLGVFSGPTLPTTLGVLSKPQQLSLRQNGNVLVCGDVRVYEFTPGGAFVGEYDVGPFEGGVAEAAGGRLFVPHGDGVALHDAATGSTTHLHGLFFGHGRKVGLLDSGAVGFVPPGQASSSTTCAGARNSTGFAARAGLIGSADVGDRLLALFGERLPRGVPVAVLFGQNPAAIQLAGGTLCLERPSSGFFPMVLQSDAQGSVLMPILRDPLTTALMGPGSTWHFQLVYRDASRVMLSDAVRVTFVE